MATKDVMGFRCLEILVTLAFIAACTWPRDSALLQ